MNQLKNGTLLVVIATFVTAVLILVTGREDVKPPEVQKDVVAVETAVETQKTDVIKLQEEVASSENETQALETVSDVVENNELTETTESPVVITAPEGPFKKSEVTEVVDQDVSSATNTSEITNNDEVVTTEAMSSQHEVLNHIVQPIWMDQKLGDFKSVDTAEAFKIMPIDSEGLQGKNPDKVVTSKKDKFAATTISSDYNYQQMPMYNGGYYIAPMPPYLMPSMLPANADNK